MIEKRDMVQQHLQKVKDDVAIKILLESFLSFCDQRIISQVTRIVESLSNTK